MIAYVGLGANLGDALATLSVAALTLRHAPGVTSCRLSPVYRSAPVDAQGPDFYNAVAALQYQGSSLLLLDLLQQCEQAHGRERPYRNAPRTLDLDLLLHGDTVLCSDRLTLPHPRLHQRAFVLRPLLDLQPGLQAPGLGALAAYLPQVEDQALVRLEGISL